MIRRVAVSLVLAGAVSACGDASGASGTTELTVYAAASMGRVLDRAAEAYTLERPGTSIVVSTDSSAALATQIEEGAPADLFLAADQASPKRLIDGGLAEGPAVTFATNGLAVIVPSGNPAGIASPADLARPGVTVIAAGDEVPITAYATELIERLSEEPGYPSGFADAYAANIASREDNVRAVLAKVALGEGDAAIVYTTDARSSSEIESVAIPDAVARAVLARYDAVVLSESPERAASTAFLEWLRDGEGRSILAAAGFGPP